MNAHHHLIPPGYKTQSTGKLQDLLHESNNDTLDNSEQVRDSILSLPRQLHLHSLWRFMHIGGMYLFPCRFNGMMLLLVFGVVKFSIYITVLILLIFSFFIYLFHPPNLQILEHKIQCSRETSRMIDLYLGSLY